MRCPACEHEHEGRCTFPTVTGSGFSPKCGCEEQPAKRAAKCGRLRGASTARIREHEIRCAACAKRYAGLNP
jgi:hypothetical protein